MREGQPHVIHLKDYEVPVTSSSRQCSMLSWAKKKLACEHPLR